MSGSCSSYCRSCAHYYSDGLYSGCVYAANMRELRPFPAGEGCRAKISKKDWLHMRAPRTNWTPEMVQQLQQLLGEGLKPTEIADRMGLRAEAVAAKVRSLPQVTHFSEEDELTAKMKKTLEGFVPVDLSGSTEMAEIPKNGGVPPEDALPERPPFRDKPTELLYQLLLEASPDMAVRIDGAPIKEVSVSVKFDDAGRENHREIYLGF